MLKIKTNGLTIMEVLVAVAIMALLAAGLYFAGSYVETQAKIKLTESTIETLAAAIDEYHDLYGKFPFEAGKYYDRNDLESPIDVNGIGGTVIAYVNDVDQNNFGNHKDEYSSIEALCYFLNKCPGSRKIINSINRSLLTNKGNTNEEFRVGTYPLIRVIDSWGKVLKYTYEQGNNFPVITSAGPDKKFGDRGPTDNDPNKARDNINSR
jgi:prepilin-type N-terminal cleavage/methylation domain-containing protein